MKVAEVEGRCGHHHTALCRGYISRKIDRADYPVEEYSGKFGKGYKIYAPNWDSTQYCWVEYWVK